MGINLASNYNNEEKFASYLMKNPQDTHLLDFNALLDPNIKIICECIEKVKKDNLYFTVDELYDYVKQITSSVTKEDIAKIYNGYTDFTNIDHVIQRIKNTYVSNKLNVEILEDVLVDLSPSGEIKIEKLENFAKSILQNIAYLKGSSKLLTPKDMADVYRDILKKRDDGIIQRDLGYLAIKDACPRQAEPGEMTLLFGPSGMGKCLKKDTPVIMYDGTISLIQNIKVGDLLMGVDSLPRKVTNTWSGFEKLYRIKQTKGEDYVVTGSHNLSLSRSINIYTKKTRSLPINKRVSIKKKGEKIIISVIDYINKSKQWKAEYKGYKSSGWELPYKKIKIDPYWLGLWIGDGAIKDTGITSKDKEIIKYIYEYADLLNMNCSEHKGKDSRCSEFNIINRGEYKINPLKKFLLDYNLLNNEKFIPEDFKYNNKEIRLQLLAGLLDSDGYLTTGTFEISTKYEKLKNDILYVARSLGFYAVAKYEKKSIKKLNFSSMYWRIRISGDVNIIPTKVSRKKAKKRIQTKDIHHTGISIIDDGFGEYYGISLDSNTDQLYILGDGTVTHNSAMAQNMQASLIAKGVPVIKFGTEMTVDSEMDRTIAMRLNISPNELFKKGREEKFNSKVERALTGFSRIKNYLHVDESSLTLQDVYNLILLGKEHFRREGVYQNGDEYTFVEIDLASMIKEISGEYGEGVEKGANELHLITKDHKVHTLLVVQANENRFRGGLRFKTPEEIDHYVFVGEDIKGGSGWKERCRMVFSIVRPLLLKRQYFPDRMDEWNLEADIIQLHCFKNNNGPEFRIPFVFNSDSFRILPYYVNKPSEENEE